MGTVVSTASAMIDADPRSGPGFDGQRLAALVRAAQAGDRTALAGLLRALGPILLRTAQRVMGNDMEAQDVAQDAMLDLARELAHLREAGAVVAYANRLTVRVALRARAKLRARNAAMPAGVGGVDDVVDATAPDDTADARGRVNALLSLVEQLPTPQAEAFLLRCVHDWGLPEIAAASGVPVNTVRSRIRLAREELQRLVRRDARFAKGDR
jgi:RNA polymerase sigma-70 factor (ECF subfamily)